MDNDELIDRLRNHWRAAGQGCTKLCLQCAAADEIERLRAANAAWMNGVADAVEPLGYDRGAACGPADLLPGLRDLHAIPPGTWRVTVHPDGMVDDPVRMRFAKRREHTADCLTWVGRWSCSCDAPPLWADAEEVDE